MQDHHDPHLSPYQGPQPRSAEPIPVRRVRFDWSFLGLRFLLAFTTYMGGERLGAANAQAHNWTLASTGSLIFGLAAAVLLIVGSVFCVDGKNQSDRRVGLVFVTIASGFIVGMSIGSML